MQFAMIAAAVVSAIGAISKAQQESEQYKAYARANDYNAAVMRQRAEQTTSAFNQREEHQRREARLQAGRRAAAVAQSGTGMGGSNLDVQEQSDVLAELDALNIRYEGQLQSQGLLAGAQLEDFYGQVSNTAAKKAKQGGWLGAAGALLSGAGNYMKAGGNFGSSGLAGGSSMAPSMGLYGNYSVYG